MRSIASIFRRLSICTAMLAVGSSTLLGIGGVAVAEDTPCVPGAGTRQPTGADAGTYTYQCSGPYTGEYTNPYYVYNPATGARTPLYSPDYQYDCASGTWSMASWNYSPSQGTFVSNRVPAPVPDIATSCPAANGSDPGPGPASDPGSNTAAANDNNGALSGTASTGSAGAGAAVTNTGAGSANNMNSSIALNSTAANNAGAAMNNGITVNSSSGDAYVVGNTSGGSAASGDATSLANIANLLQSTTNVFGPGTTVFTANINGDVTGDFMFDPSAIMDTGPNSVNGAGSDLQVNTQAVNGTSAGINNTIDVGAATGNAAVANNTTGGDASSGDAKAIVNLMNLINSTIAAGNSFVGTININGNLNGDILLPQGMIDQLLAGTGPNSSNSAAANVTDNSVTTNTVTQAVANNINSQAQTGVATVSGNTAGGNAASGTAGTNITLLNLTGSSTVGKNDLLVFVNVLGKWVGMILNAPAGTTAAELGGGITSSNGTGPDASNSAAADLTENSSTINNTTLGITNNVNVHAASGDATVTSNTAGGNAASGDATTAVNILNMLGSNLSLSDWFGVLFINVFGMWNGSFGVNTDAGDPINTPAAIGNPDSDPTSNPVQAATHQALIDSFRQFARFAAARNNTGGSQFVTTSASQSGSDRSVLGGYSILAKQAEHTGNQHNKPAKSHAGLILPAVGFGLAILILVAGERDRIFRVLQKK